MKRLFTLLLVPFTLMLLLSSCATRDGVWGMYQTAQENGNYESIEFAYSKCIYIADQSAVRDEGSDDGDDGRDEGWYTQDGDKVTCTFTSTEENGESVKTEMEFTYSIDNALTLTHIKTTKKSADGQKTEEDAEYNKLFKGE